MAYSQEVADKICELISEGITLREICRDPGMPSKSQVYNWLDAKHPDYQSEFPGRFARARMQGFDCIAEGCIEIADDARNDYMDKLNERGEVVGRMLDPEHVQRSKLRIWTRLELLSKWDSKRFGAKIDVDVTAKVDASISYKANIPQRGK